MEFEEAENTVTVSSLLEAWGFHAYERVFLENEVDIEALELLDDDQIKTLIPPIGPQAKFKKKLSIWKAAAAAAKPPALSKDTESEELDTSILDNIVSLCEESVPASPVSSASVSEASYVSGVSATSSSGSSLLKVLEKTQDGQLLLRERSQPLGDPLRKLLTREIAKAITHSDPKAPVTTDIYLHWGNEIAKVFPAENCAVYYTARKGAGRPHGRLFDAVTNLKAKYRKNRIYQARARRSLDRTLTPESANSHQRITLNKEDLIHTDADQELNTQEIEECLEWLKSSVDNYALCAEKWQYTNELRLQRVLSEKEVQTYLKDFPCIKRSWGLKLLIGDFDRWYPGNELIFQNKFPLLKNKLLALPNAKILGKSTFVSKLKTLAKDSDPQTSALAALMLIPHILGPVHLKRKKCSASEVRESFILHIEEEKQLNEARKERLEKYKDLGITIQPYIIVAGPLEKITARYVVLDDIIYDIASIEDAVDACFKIIWALYLEYPRECLHVWQFLQRAIYNIPNVAVDNKEKITSSVLALLSDCGVSTK